MEIKANNQKEHITVTESDPLKYLFIMIGLVVSIFIISSSFNNYVFYSNLEKLSLSNEDKLIAIACFENNRTCSNYKFGK